MRRTRVNCGPRDVGDPVCVKEMMGTPQSRAANRLKQGEAVKQSKLYVVSVE